MKRLLLAAVLTLSATAAHAVPILQLIPTSVGAFPGAVTGWGYDITNPDNNFVFLNDSFVTGGLSTGTFGNYVDYIAANFIVIGPGGDTGPVPFNRAGMMGVGEFDFNAVVPVGTHITGGISIDFEAFSQDPNSPTFDPGSFIGSGTFSATAAAAATPEPSSTVLMGLALSVIGLALWKRRAHSLRID